MKIDVYATIKDEIQILPYWLRHYETFADRIFVWDDGSTDGTKEMLAAHPNVFFLPREKAGHDDEYYVGELFPVYKQISRGVVDWVMPVDADEFVYHPNLLDLLKQAKEDDWKVIQCAGYSMISDIFPTTSGQIYDEVQMGFPERLATKWVIHSPEIDIRYRRGRHVQPHIEGLGNGKRKRGSGAKLLHYRYLGEAYIESRDRRNFEGCAKVGRTAEGEVYTRDRIRRCPDGSHMTIFEWLKAYKDKATNIIQEVQNEQSLNYHDGKE